MQLSLAFVAALAAGSALGAPAPAFVPADLALEARSDLPGASSAWAPLSKRGGGGPDASLLQSVASSLLTGYTSPPYVTATKKTVHSASGDRFDVTRVNATLGRGLAWAGDYDYIPKIATGPLVSWYHHWELGPINDMPQDVEYVPMFWGRKKLAQWKAVSSQFNSSHLPKYVLAHNEPDVPSQANSDVQSAVDDWMTYLAPLQDKGVRVSSPQIVWNTVWLTAFMKELKKRGREVDFVAAHWYGAPDHLDQFKSYVETLRANYNKTVWISEYGTTTKANGTAQQIADFNQATVMWMQNQTYVERAAWFGCFDQAHAPDAFGAKLNAFFKPDGSLTSMANNYMSNNKTEADGQYSAAQDGVTSFAAGTYSPGAAASSSGANGNGNSNSNKGGNSNSNGADNGGDDDSDNGAANSGNGNSNRVDSSAWQTSTGATQGFVYKDVPQNVKSMAQLLAMAPRPLQAIGETIQQAAAAENLQPQLLVAVAMTESTGCTDMGSYGGCFQFTSDESWAEYGNGQNRNNNAAAAWGAARYLHDLVLQSGGSLYQALRQYNGPIGQGGSPTYQSTVLGYMQGQGF